MHFINIDGFIYDYDCTLLVAAPGGATSVVIPASVIEIREHTFNENTIISSVTFEEDSKITIINSYAFFGATNIESITIPLSVTTVGANAFGGWTEDQTIYIQHRTRIPSTWATSWKGNSMASIIFLKE